MNDNIISKSSLPQRINDNDHNANSGMFEKKWFFEKNATANYDFTLQAQGAEYACNKFDPESVSFIVTYFPEKAVPKIDSHNTGKVEKLKDGTYQIDNVQKLDISLRGGGKYTIQNTTGQKISGTDCDIGIIGGIDDRKN